MLSCICVNVLNKDVLASLCISLSFVQ